MGIRVRRFRFLGVAVSLATLATGCVTQGVYDAVVVERDSLSRDKITLSSVVFLHDGTEVLRRVGEQFSVK